MRGKLPLCIECSSGKMRLVTLIAYKDHNGRKDEYVKPKRGLRVCEECGFVRQWIVGKKGKH